MTIRTIEFMYHTSKYILKRNQMENVKRVVILIVEMLVLVPIGFFISRFIEVNSYVSWLFLAIIVGIISLLGVVIVNGIIYRKDLKDLLDMIKRIFKRKEGSNKMSTYFVTGGAGFIGSTLSEKIIRFRK